MSIAHNLDDIRNKFAKAAEDHQRYYKEVAGIFQAACQLLTVLEDQNFSASQKNNEIDIIIRGSLTIAAAFFDFLTPSLVHRFQSRPVSWDDFMLGFDIPPQYSANYFPLGFEEKCSMILTVGTESMNFGDYENKLERLFPFLKEDLIRTRARQKRQTPDHVYKSMNIEQQRDFETINDIFKNALIACEVTDKASIDHKKRFFADVQKSFSSQLDTGINAALAGFINANLDSANQAKFCENPEEYQLRKKFHSALSELREKTLRDFRNHKKTFNAENCKILANSAKDLATAFADNKVTPDQISQFKKNIKNFHGCSWPYLIAYTLLTILFATTIAVGGALIGGMVAGPVGMASGAAAGFALGALASSSLTIWSHRERDAITQMTTAATRLAKQ